jgi:CxxC motif-containing protein
MQEPKKNMRCIVCPEGCILSLQYDNKTGGLLKVVGHRCKRGIKFAEEEIINPVRTLTTTVKISSKKAVRLAVRSSIPVRRDKILSIIKAIRKLEVMAPVMAGDIIIHDVLGTGADIISCSSVRK